MKLFGQTILITGGTSGIGKAFAERLADLGNKVIICGRRQDRLDEIKQQYPEIVTFTCDISNPDSRKYLIENILDEYPDVNVIINNAGIQLAHDLTEPVDASIVSLEMETNFVAPVHLSSLLADHLKDKRTAAIVNISSGLAFTPLSFMPVYCASKAALHSWTLSLRKQLEKTPIKVYEIAPPAVDTELGHQQRHDASQSHGGMPVDEFIDGAIKALENDEFQVGIGPAAHMMEKRDEFFEELNASL